MYKIYVHPYNYAQEKFYTHVHMYAVYLVFILAQDMICGDSRDIVM